MRDTVAVCMVRANEEFQRDSLCAIYEQTKKYGLKVQVYNAFEELNSHDLNDLGEESIFERIDYDRLCGMILFCEKIKDNELNMRLIDRAKKNGIPVVTVDRRMEGCYSILFDCSDAFEQMVRHLIEVHHCKKLFVMGGLRNNDFSDERIELVRRVAAEYGIEEGRFSIPKLTTCEQNITAGGNKAVDIIWNVMQNIKVDKEIRIPFTPLFSQSCGCEKFEAKESLGKVHYLYNSLMGYKQFTKYMYDMINEMTGTRWIWFCWESGMPAKDFSCPWLTTGEKISFPENAGENIQNI